MLYINHGDITAVTSGVIAHGVNLQNVMGSGVAKAIYTKWPMVKSLYHAAFEEFYAKPKLGDAEVLLVASGLYIVNCFTQERFGKDGKRYACPNAIELALTKTLNIMTVTNLCNLHIPRIGCDLGGLDWNDDVRPVLLRLANKYPHIRINVWEIDKRKL